MCGRAMPFTAPLVCVALPDNVPLTVDGELGAVIPAIYGRSPVLPLYQWWESPWQLPAEHAKARCGFTPTHLCFYLYMVDGDVISYATANDQKMCVQTEPPAAPAAAAAAAAAAALLLLLLLLLRRRRRRRRRHAQRRRRRLPAAAAAAAASTTPVHCIALVPDQPPVVASAGGNWATVWRCSSNRRTVNVLTTGKFTSRRLDTSWISTSKIATTGSGTRR